MLASYRFCVCIFSILSLLAVVSLYFHKHYLPPTSRLDTKCQPSSDRSGHDSGLTWEDEASHVVKGIICIFGLIGSILIFERPFINEVLQLIWSKRKKLAQD